MILAVNSKLESQGVCAQHCVAVFFLSGEGDVGKGFGECCTRGVLDEYAGVGREYRDCCKAGEYRAGHRVSV